MNIFILSKSRDYETHMAEQAWFHCDKHVIKMIAESVQMLVTALSYGSNYDPDIGNVADSYTRSMLPCNPLARSMHKHPCSIWTMQNITNFTYVAELAIALCNEQQHRWPLNARHQYHEWLLDVQKVLTMLRWGKKAGRLPDNFAVAVKNDMLRSVATEHQIAVGIYRAYYRVDKTAFATWKRRPIPAWFAVEHQVD